MSSESALDKRCGLETVEFARVEQLVRDHPPSELARFFTLQELQETATSARRVALLASRFAAKTACCKLFARETALSLICPSDFALGQDTDGEPAVKPSSNAQAVLDRYRIAEIRLSLTQSEASASAKAWAKPKPTEVPWFGRWFYHLFPYRRNVALENLRRVFGDVLPEEEIHKLAQAYYAHYLRFTMEFVRLPFMSAERRKAWIRLENIEAPLRAHEKGKGILLLTGHFGNFEVSTVAGISQFPQYRGLFHFVRRPLKPRLLNAFVTYRFRRHGFGVLPKRGSLDRIFELLAHGAIIVYVFDQHAGKGDGITVDFFGHPAGTFKSVALLALTTGAPVIPAYSWREPNGRHVLRFEDELPLIECDDVGEAIRINTQAYNRALERMLLRHPEQWIWMHRRWKVRNEGLELGGG